MWISQCCLVLHVLEFYIHGLTQYVWLVTSFFCLTLCLRVNYIFMWNCSSAFSSHHTILSHTENIMYWFILLYMNIWVHKHPNSCLGLLQITLLSTFLHLSPVHTGTHFLRRAWLGHSLRVFSFLTWLQIVFWGAYTNLHSKQQSLRVPIALYSNLQLILSIFQILNTLVGF